MEEITNGKDHHERTKIELQNAQTIVQDFKSRKRKDAESPIGSAQYFDIGDNDDDDYYGPHEQGDDDYVLEEVDGNSNSEPPQQPIATTVKASVKEKNLGPSEKQISYEVTDVSNAGGEPDARSSPSSGAELSVSAVIPEKVANAAEDSVTPVVKLENQEAEVLTEDDLKLHAQYFSHWRRTFFKNTAPFSGRGELGVQWISFIEKVTSVDELADDGPGWERFSRLLAEALLGMLSGEFRQKIILLQKDMIVKGHLFNGRQLVFMLLQEYKQGKTEFDWVEFDELLNIHIHGGYLQACANGPEVDQVRQCKHSEQHYDHTNEAIMECSHEGLEKNYDKLREWYLAKLDLKDESKCGSDKDNEKDGKASVGSESRKNVNGRRRRLCNGQDAPIKTRKMPHGRSLSRERNRPVCDEYIDIRCAKGAHCKDGYVPDCRFHRQGRCSAGDKCKFAHGDTAGAVLNPTPKSYRPKFPRKSKAEAEGSAGTCVAIPSPTPSSPLSGAYSMGNMCSFSLFLLW